MIIAQEEKSGNAYVRNKEAKANLVHWKIWDEEKKTAEQVKTRRTFDERTAMHPRPRINRHPSKLYNHYKSSAVSLQGAFLSLLKLATGPGHPSLRIRQAPPLLHCQSLSVLSPCALIYYPAWLQTPGLILLCASS